MKQILGFTLALLVTSTALSAADWEIARTPSKSFEGIFDLAKITRSLQLMAVFAPDGTCTSLINKITSEDIFPLLEEALASKSKACSLVNIGPGEVGNGISSIDVYVFEDIACPPCVTALTSLKQYTQQLGDKAPKVRVLVIDPTDRSAREAPCKDCDLKSPDAKE